ncbi:MAG: DUF934 domain-containing protein [Pseudomonadota bacterium]
MTTLTFKGGEFVELERRDQEIAFEDWANGARPSESSDGAAALVLSNDADLDAIGPDLHRLAAVILQFPDFKDGRAYSQARLLRDRYGFKGQIVARGDVLCDQALFMVRSGFTVLEIGERDVAAFHRALGAFSHFYQSGADGSWSVFHERAKARAAA